MGGRQCYDETVKFSFKDEDGKSAFVSWLQSNHSGQVFEADLATYEVTLTETLGMPLTTLTQITNAAERSGGRRDIVRDGR